MDQPQDTNRQGPVTPPGGTPPPPPPEDAAPPPPMTPMAWLANNAVFLVAMAGLIALVVHYKGVEGLWYAAQVVFGIGFLIFVHELGHFAVAKWCDVHVQTFSIGFGPALPGCSFQRGETTYKIGAIPLGGYVNMVGEGPEADEDENYPRSFKNKSVGQRMLIISAGVIMNVLVGAMLFIIVYMYHGEERQPATVGMVEPGSPLWQKGVRTGSIIKRLGNINHPYFDDLRLKVALSASGEEILFVFADPDGSHEREVYLLPRKSESDPNPIIGLAPPDQLKLYASGLKTALPPPVVAGSAAAAARALGLAPGEVVISTSDPDNPNSLKDLPRGDYAELARRVRKLAGHKLVLRVLSAGAKPDARAQEREVPLEGFTYEDEIVGATKPQPAGRGYDPFAVSPIPEDPRNPGSGHRDPFEFYRRMLACKGQPMVIQVHRKSAGASAPPVDLFVPPSYHVTFGLCMQMGEVVALREGSTAEKAGIQRGDLIVRAALLDDKGKTLGEWTDLDPMRLPAQLANTGAAHPGKKVVALTVKRSGAEGGATELTKKVEWDDSWDADEEVPIGQTAPVALPQLGLAYRVANQVFRVDRVNGGPSPAEKAVQFKSQETSAPLRKGDEVRGLWFQSYSSAGDKEPWDPELDLKSTRNDRDVYEDWPWVVRLMQGVDVRKVRFRVHHDDKTEDEVVLTAVEDENWPSVDRGFQGRLVPEYSIEKAANFGEAVGMGVRKTGRWITNLYLQIRSLATGRISSKRLGGPIAIIAQGFAVASMGWWQFLSFLGVMSINLAVVNFLPIPLLDGGHMVFLIYEKLRGRPPSEAVRVGATYIGLGMILALFVFVTYQDFFNHLKWW